MILEMTRSSASLLFALFLTAAPVCFAQTRVAISYPELDQKEQVVHIHYHIEGSISSDKFRVALLITDQGGEKLDARSLSGDVGADVSGGGQKHIVWDAGADSILLDQTIDVLILVEALTPTRRELLALEDAQRQQEEHAVQALEELNSTTLPGAKLPPQVQIKSFSRGGLVSRSLLYPGWGLSIVKRKPHWIKGLAAYGCVVGSVVLNRKAIETFGQIEDFEDYPTKDELYQQAVLQDNLSEVLAYTAVGIWAADFIWTLVGTRGIKNFEVHPKMDPLTYTPMLGITYRF